MTNQRVDELCKIIQAAEKELKEIRATCPHPGYEVGWWEWNRPTFCAVRICTTCWNSIPGVTAEERAKLGPLFKHGSSGREGG